MNFDPDTVPFLRISGGPGDGAVFYLAEQERNCCLILAQENGPLPLALLPSGTAQWVQELSWLQDLSTVAAQAHSFAAYFGSLTGRYASIRDADLVEEVRQLLSSSNPQDGTLDPAELYYDSCLIFCGEGGGELGRLSLSSREMCHALVQISDRQEDRDRPLDSHRLLASRLLCGRKDILTPPRPASPRPLCLWEAAYFPPVVKLTDFRHKKVVFPAFSAVKNSLRLL